MPITNLAIQRRRLNELYDLTQEKELELFSVELTSTYHYGGSRRFSFEYECFVVHARQLTPKNVRRLADIGFKIEKVTAMNEHTLILEVRKPAPEREK